MPAISPSLHREEWPSKAWPVQEFSRSGNGQMESVTGTKLQALWCQVGAPPARWKSTRSRLRDVTSSQGRQNWKRPCQPSLFGVSSDFKDKADRKLHHYPVTDNDAEGSQPRQNHILVASKTSARPPPTISGFKGNLRYRSITGTSIISDLITHSSDEKSAADSVRSVWDW